MRPSAAQPLALRLRGNASRADDPAPAASAEAGAERTFRPGPMLAGAPGVPGTVGLTLLFPSTPTYDPWAWMLWGREIVHLDLVTEGGPSWKPLPVLFTVPFSLFGEDLAPYLWLWIARAGALLALVMAFRLARRLTGRGPRGGGRRGGGHARSCSPPTSSCATRCSATRRRCWRRWPCGRSSATSTAAATTRSTWASPPRCCGRRHGRSLALYGLWLWFREPELRLRVAAVGAGSFPLLWFGPELWGSGEPLRASSRANNPNPGSAAFADHPGLEVAKRFAERTVDAARGAGCCWRPCVAGGLRCAGRVRRALCWPWPASAWPGSASWRS